MESGQKRDTSESKKNPRPGLSRLLRDPAMGLAFGFGAGLSPKAPGTFGTLVAVPVYFFIQHWPPGYYCAWLVASFALGVYLCHHSARALGVHDHPGIVWDEMVGYWITMFVAPAGWGWMALGFALFRLFDIVKPWPVGWADRRVGGGLGIMLDDLLAALYALGILQLAVFVSVYF